MLDLDNQVADYIFVMTKKTLIKPRCIQGYLVLPWRTIEPLEW